MVEMLRYDFHADSIGTMSGNFMSNIGISKYEAQTVMTDMLKEYERDVIVPRHTETQKSIAEIKDIVSQGRGMMTLGRWLFCLGSGCWVVIQIVTALRHS